MFQETWFCLTKKTPPRVENVWKKDESRPCFVGEENVFQEWYCFNGYHPSNPKLDIPQPLPFLPSFNIKNHLGNLLAPIGVNVLIGTLPRNRKPSKQRKPSISRKVHPILPAHVIKPEFYINFFKIIYRYDNSPNSEYRILYTILRDGEFPIPDWVQVIDKIKDVHKSDIYPTPVELTSWFKLELPRYAAANNNYFELSLYPYRLLGVTFEKDHGPNIWEVKIQNTDYKIKCRMHGKDEYYQTIDINLSLIDLPFFSWSVYGKGYVNIYRFE